MDRISIALVTPQEVPVLDVTLRQLAADIGIDYSAGQDTLAAVVCIPDASSFAMLPTRVGEPIGAVLVAPLLSTNRGGVEEFVSNLRVAETARGKGVTRRLLANTFREGPCRNAGHFVKLGVYRDDTGARAAYGRLGFIAQADETNMNLTGRAIEILKVTA